MATHPETERELLEMWGRGLRLRNVERGLLLLSTARPDDAPETLEDWPVGWRDVAILRLRERLFGSELDAVAACPSCGERLESSCRVADLINSADAQLTATGPPELGTEVVIDGRSFLIRPPTSRDLVSVASRAGGNLPKARQLLLDLCVQTLDPESDKEPLDLLELEQAAEQAIVAADPQAGLTLETTCPACDAEVVVPWDIVAFVWRELHSWALHTMHEIHCLAVAYGWTERDVLEIPPLRRRFYLDMVWR